MSNELTKWKEVVDEGVKALQKKVDLVEATQATIEMLIKTSEPGLITLAQTLSDLIVRREREYEDGLKCHENISKLINTREKELKSLPAMSSDKSFCFKKNGELLDLHSRLLTLEFSFVEKSLKMDSIDIINLEGQFQSIQKQPHRSAKDIEGLTASAFDVAKKNPRGFAASFALRVIVALTTAPVPDQKQETRIRPGSIVGPASFTGSTRPANKKGAVPLHHHLSLVKPQKPATQSLTSQSSLSPGTGS